MTDDQHVQRLLDELLDAGGTPEEVCAGRPELLAEVRARWRRLRRFEAHLDALFPPSARPGAPPAPRPEGTPLPRVPGYEVESLLGRGGMGVVFRARHLRLGRVVALKMTLGGAYAGPDELERFQREAEVVARLRHPHIVQIYDIGDSEGRPYFTMEYVAGGSLAERLAGRPQPPREAAALLATLAEAVGAAHQAGIVHRDLKPANVLLAADGTPRISDFGLARLLDDEAGLTRTGGVAGTPSYMAPEQAAGQRLAVGPAADVYALGAILYEALAGRPPFRAGTAAETLSQVISQDPAPPSRWNARAPRDLEIICLKCLHKQPLGRYPSAAALAEDLQRFLVGEAIHARPEGRLGRVARRVRRRPALATALVAAALSAAVVVGGGLWLLSERSAAARRADAEQAVAGRAAGGYLREMVGHMREANWPEAKTALERASAWLGQRGSAELRGRIEQGRRDLELVARLEAVRLTGYARVGLVLDFARADGEYEEAFREAGLGTVADRPEVVAARVKASDVRNALLAAVDHWSACTRDPRRRRWALEVARQVEGDTTGWRDRAGDPAVWNDEAALLRVLETTPVSGQSVAYLLAVEMGAQGPMGRHVAFLKRVHERHPRDLWVNLRLGNALMSEDKPAEAVGYYQTALAIRPGLAIGHNNLGRALSASNRPAEAVWHYRLAVAHDPTDGASRLNLAACLWNMGRRDEAGRELPAALRLNPRSAFLHTLAGLVLERKKRTDEALAEYRTAVALDPKYDGGHLALRTLLRRQGRLGEACVAWGKALDADPPGHDAWYGYAELCLYLGREEDYSRARRALLRRFGATADLLVAERAGRACLLRPASGDELRQAVARAGRAGAAGKAKAGGAYPYFQFVQGLAEYRQGRFGRAIALMRGDAAGALGPAPRLVLAMALSKSGQPAEAKKTLAAAVRAYDWRADTVRDQDGWICHVFRREAESMIRPK
jgi:serine/threonine-protein kinase